MILNFKYYNTNKLIIFILVLSVFYNYVSKYIESIIIKHKILNEAYSYFGVFSTIALITSTIIFIDLIGWRFKIFSWLINIPNLNGRYTGEVVSSYQSSGVPVKKVCVMEIKQTASKLHIFTYFADINTNLNTSSSFSVIEQIIPEENNTFSIFYIFSNETAPLFNLNNHVGTAKLKYYKDILTLEGEYYNQRNNNGTIKIHFSQKKLLGRLV